MHNVALMISAFLSAISQVPSIHDDVPIIISGQASANGHMTQQAMNPC